MKIKFKRKYLDVLLLIIIPLSFLFWLIFSIFNFSRISFTLSTYETKNEISKSEDKSGTNIGHSFKGMFRASDNNLGLVYLRLYPNKQYIKNEQNVIFRLKEKNSREWIIERKYLSTQFDSQEFFTFGFPIINNSKNKEYEFEILPENINKANLSFASNNKFISGYKYSKEEIIGSSGVKLDFIKSKTFGFLSDNELLKKSAPLLGLVLVFIFVLILIRFILPNEKTIHINFENKFLKILLFSFLILILLPSNLDYFISSFIIIMWIVISWIFNFKSKSSFVLCLFLILIWIFITLLHKKEIDNSINFLVYALFIIGTVQLLIEELKYKNEKKNN